MVSEQLSLLEQIRLTVSADLAAADGMIRHELTSDVALVNQVSDYIIGAGGKRLRPLICLLAARAVGLAPVDRQVAGAVIIEFIHTATLLHDDVVDGSSQRRGRHTANQVWGNAASVLVGDFLYSRAFQLMVKLGNPRVMDIMADATNVIAEGEVLQLMNTNDPDTTEERYLDVIYRKTARLFEAGTQIAGVIAGTDAATERALAAYGRHLGNAFQLVDDVLDYRGTHEKRGKNIGDDLAEGKPTLPVIYGLQHGTASEKAVLRSAIETGSLAELDKVLAAIESSGGLEYTVKRAEGEAQQALAALQPLTGSAHKEALIKLAGFAVSRTY
jgi:octaprenyl-diphosphate synthase